MLPYSIIGIQYKKIPLDLIYSLWLYEKLKGSDIEHMTYEVALLGQ